MTYDELVTWCGSERMAYFLSTQLDYRNMTELQLQNAVIALLVLMKQRAARKRGEPVELEYLGGQRRDTLRP